MTTKPPVTAMSSQSDVERCSRCTKPKAAHTRGPRGLECYIGEDLCWLAPVTAAQTDQPHEQCEALVMEDLSAQAWCQGIRPHIDAANADEFVSKVLAAIHADRAAMSIRITTLEQARDAALKKAEQYRLDCVYHSDCRPNRQQAEAAIADARVMNDKWADEVAAHRHTSEARDALRQALRDLCSSHDGYRHGLGPCICAAHEAARKALEADHG